MLPNEQIVTGRSFRKCIDATNKLWQKISFWSKASDIEFDDGENAETKLGAIKGITADLNTSEAGYAADMMALAQLNNQIVAINVRIQDNANRINALDTRVTNAITGGSLTAPFEYNILLYPYKDTGWNNKDTTTLRNCNNSQLQWTAEGNDSWGNKGGVNRVWTIPSIKIDAKTKLDFSYTFTSTYPKEVRSVTCILTTSAGTISITLNGTTNLAQFAGKIITSATFAFESECGGTTYQTITFAKFRLYNT